MCVSQYIIGTVTLSCTLGYFPSLFGFKKSPRHLNLMVVPSSCLLHCNGSFSGLEMQKLRAVLVIQKIVSPESASALFDSGDA